VSEDLTPDDNGRAPGNDYFAPLDLNNYHTDKITNGYMNIYGPIFAPLRSKPIKLLELGVLGGESLRLWRDYFWNGTIVGLDLNPVTINDSKGRIFVYQGAQEDTVLLSRIAQEQASDGFTSSLMMPRTLLI